MQLKLVLRLVVAVVFAIVAVIFTTLIPDIPGTDTLTLKTLITLAAALVGFVLFPDLATWFTRMVFSLYNVVINRITAEVSSAMLRLQREGPRVPPLNPIPTVGGMSISRPYILDTSAIIDGRILDVAKTGFVSGLALIPNFVLLELQQVADSGDNLKRSRGRRGFEVVEELKKLNGLKVEIWDKDSGGKAVDERLMKLVKNLHGKLVTTDFNLNKVASAHGLTVLNINDLANSVKTAVIPGEKLEVKIMHVGKDPKQGVAYLPDGTMIVVEDGGEALGRTVKVEVSRLLQGSAGKMIFAKKS